MNEWLHYISNVYKICNYFHIQKKEIMNNTNTKNKKAKTEQNTAQEERKYPHWSLNLQWL